MLDSAPLLDAVAGTGDPGPILPASEWNADRILAVPTLLLSLLPEVARAGATA